MSKRAVLYALVSKDDTSNENRNLAGQLAMCREYAEKAGWTVIEELQEDDRGASGVSLDLPTLNRVLEMAQLGAFEVLVVRELDRLSRSLAKQLLIEEELRRSGVQIAYVLGDYPDTLEGTLSKHIRAAIAEYERLKIRERTQRARRLKVKSGQVLLHGDRPPYGYSVSEDGQGLVICKLEAEVVRLIGRWYYGRRNIGGYPRKPMGNPRSHWIAVAVPAIVDEDLWTRAAQRKQSNKDRAARNTKHPYLMGKRMICGACGAKIYAHTLGERKYRAKSYGYYVCSNSDRRGKPVTCDSPQFSSAAVDDAIWHWLKTLLVDPSALEVGLRRHQAETEKANRPLRQRLDVLEDLIASNHSQMERLLDLYLIGEIPRDLLAERRKRLEHTISSLQTEASKLRTQLESDTLTAEQIESLLEFAANVSNGLAQADADFATRVQIVNRLAVEGSLVVEDGEKVVHARCILDEAKFPIVSTTSIDIAPYTPAPPRRWPAPARAIPPAGC